MLFDFEKFSFFDIVTNPARLSVTSNRNHYGGRYDCSVLIINLNY